MIEGGRVPIEGGVLLRRFEEMKGFVSREFPFVWCQSLHKRKERCRKGFRNSELLCGVVGGTAGETLDRDVSTGEDGVLKVFPERQVDPSRPPVSSVE